MLEASHMREAFGEHLIDDLSFTLPRNSTIISVIGPNGIGKSTLFKTMVGGWSRLAASGELKIGDTVGIRLREPEP